MSEVEVFTTVIGVCGTVAAIVFAYIAFKRNNKADDTADGKKDGVLMTEIGYIKSGVDDIKRKQERDDDRYVDVAGRLSAVEQSAKQAHHRIDTIREELQNMK